MTFNPLRFEHGCNTSEDVRAKNILLNSQRDIPWLTEKAVHGRSLAIVAGGPSLKYRWPEIYQYDSVLVLNNAYSFLLRKGITPNYFMMLDARYENIDFVQGHSFKTKHFLSAQCHPEIFDHLPNVTLYFSNEENAKAIKAKKLMLSAPAGTVGMKALSLAFALGYRDVHLFGYDSSYQETHHAFNQSLNDDSQTIEVFIEKEGKKYVTTPAFSQQAFEFPSFAKDLVSLGMSIELHCDGLLPDLVEASNKRGEIPIEEREREKYSQIWQRDYGKYAPGEEFVDTAIGLLGIKPFETIIDYGCGSGKGAYKFMERGFDITGVDFVKALEREIPFIESCLWDLPQIESDYAYCTDVMEHIPTEKVLDVLKGISERTRKGAFFNIATRDDVCGGMIGRRLHMTVMTAQAWRNILSKYWDVEMIENEGEAQFICN